MGELGKAPLSAPSHSAVLASSSWDAFNSSRHVPASAPVKAAVRGFALKTLFMARHRNQTHRGAGRVRISPVPQPPFSASAQPLCLRTPQEGSDISSRFPNDELDSPDETSRIHAPRRNRSSSNHPCCFLTHRWLPSCCVTPCWVGQAAEDDQAACFCPSSQTLQPWETSPSRSASRAMGRHHGKQRWI